MQKITPLRVGFDFGNGKNTIYPVVLTDENETILIDCGYPRFLPYMESAAGEEGIDLARLTHIVITHHDFDHIGALAAVKRKYPHISIIASEDDVKYINGREKSLRLRQAEALYEKLPEEEKPGALNFQKLLGSVEGVNVDLTVKDGDTFSWLGGTDIIATPGHMPGHISIYIKAYKTLISGDALVIENGELEIANPNYTLDMSGAKNSIKKLLDYDIEKIICYHGGEYTGDIKASLHKLSNT
ncbi:MAG: metallo-beta-lactamase family protein [Eubacterium sp.]|nr:metallo-beta-lactamase family protein [Eubacterium sp.]